MPPADGDAVNEIAVRVILNVAELPRAVKLTPATVEYVALGNTGSGYEILGVFPPVIELIASSNVVCICATAPAAAMFLTLYLIKLIAPSVGAFARPVLNATAELASLRYLRPADNELKFVPSTRS